MSRGVSRWFDQRRRLKMSNFFKSWVAAVKKKFFFACGGGWRYQN
jgi:hypothetical protein